MSETELKVALLKENDGLRAALAAAEAREVEGEKEKVDE